MLLYQYSIFPRVLVDVSKVDMSTSILGYRTSSPIMIAPTSVHRLAHPEGMSNLFCSSLSHGILGVSHLTVDYVFGFVPGEVATARAAAECDTIMVLRVERILI